MTNMIIVLGALTTVVKSLPTANDADLKFNPLEHRLYSDEDLPECPEIDQRSVNDEVEPKFKLNPKLFITPVYIWGPSSQLQGLRESIGVAIRLNRTLLLPPFLTHQSDSKGGDKPVPVDIRLDIPELRKLLSIGFTEDLRCRQSDVVFLARGIYNKPTDPSVMLERVKRIDSFEKATQMKIIRRTPDTTDIDEQRPFLERSIPVTRSPKVSGAGVQLSNRVTNDELIQAHCRLFAINWLNIQPCRSVQLLSKYVLRQLTYT